MVLTHLLLPDEADYAISISENKLYSIGILHKNTYTAEYCIQCDDVFYYILS